MKSRGSDYFYFYISLVIAAVIVYGFSHTIDKNLIHATVPRPTLLYIHVAVFSAWVVFFIFQSALIRVKNAKLHMRLGWIGVGLGTAIPVIGISTAIVMAHFRAAHFHASNTEADLVVQFLDMLSFGALFYLGIFARKRIEFHRRFLFMASCTLTSAAFGRFPHEIIPLNLFYTGVDALIFVGVFRDLLVDRTVHRAYLYTLLFLVIAQTLTMHISRTLTSQF